jgi:hypothetical protein
MAGLKVGQTMDVAAFESRMSRSDISTTYGQTAGSWTGCDWPVHFGKFGLNLNGLRSRQAVLIAGATSGAEAAEWRRAAKWLAHVEQDARQAETLARAAVDLAARDDLRAALESAEDACRIEARYHRRLLWQAVRDGIAAQLNVP